MATGTTLNAGNANLTMTLNTGAGLTNSTSGNITLENLTTTGHVLVKNVGPTAASSILRASVNSLVTAASAAFDVNGAGGGGSIGTSGNPMRVTATNLEGRAQSGGAFFTSPSQMVTVGGATLGGLTGIATSSNGNIAVTASSGGVRVSESIIANGSGTVTLTGTGLASGANNYGIEVYNGAVVQSTSGAITLTGTGGAGTLSNYGVLVVDAGSQITSSSGNISITGTGGAGSSNDNEGILIWNGGLVQSTGTGTITLSGTGGAGTSSNFGVAVWGPTATVTSANGNISITGIAGADGSNVNNWGIVLHSGGIVESTGTATLTLSGTGGAGWSDNYGVYVTGAGSKVTSATGNVGITGTGGGGSSDSNHGIIIDSSGIVESTGTATLTLTGTGGAGAGLNHGVYVFGASSKVTSATGNISITGTGGAGSGVQNYGIYLLNGVVESTGTATLTLNGTGGVGTDSNYGMYVAGGTVQSVNGNISITGQGAGSAGGFDQEGVDIYSGGIVQSTGTATITIVGTGGSGSGGRNLGVTIWGPTGKVTSATGAISITGTAGGTGGLNYGIYLTHDPAQTGGMVESTGSAAISLTGTGADGDAGIATALSGNSIGGASATGPITLTADIIDLSYVSIQSTGALTLQPLTASRNITIGADNASDFALNPLEISNLIDGFSSITIGRTSDGTGTVTINPVTFNDPVTIAGGSIAFARTSSRDFDGTGDYITLANESNFDFERTNAFSSGGWFKVSDFSDYRMLVTKMPEASPYSGWVSYVQPTTGKLTFALVNTFPTNYLQVSTAVGITAAVWNHIYFTYDGSSTAAGIKIYVNGISQSFTVDAATLSASILTNEPVIIGQRSGGAIYDFLGQAAHVGVYASELNAAQVDQLRLYPTSITANLKAYLPLGVSGTETDFSTYANNGTPTNTTVSAANQAPVTILNTGANNLTLTARTGGIQGSGAGTDINTASLTATAVTGIGSTAQLVTSNVTSGSATTSGAGAAAINIANSGASALTLSSLATVGANAPITFAQIRRRRVDRDVCHHERWRHHHQQRRREPHRDQSLGRGQQQQYRRINYHHVRQHCALRHQRPDPKSHGYERGHSQPAGGHDPGRGDLRERNDNYARRQSLYKCDSDRGRGLTDRGGDAGNGCHHHDRRCNDGREHHIVGR